MFAKIKVTLHESLHRINNVIEVTDIIAICFIKYFIIPI